MAVSDKLPLPRTKPANPIDSSRCDTDDAMHRICCRESKIKELDSRLPYTLIMVSLSLNFSIKAPNDQNYE